MICKPSIYSKSQFITLTDNVKCDCTMSGVREDNDEVKVEVVEGSVPQLEMG